MIPLNYYLILGAILFGIGLAGIVINRSNLIVLLMSIEIMLLAVNMNFISLAQYLNIGAGEIFVFFILTVAAAESSIGLAILVLLYRRLGSINVQEMDLLKG